MDSLADNFHPQATTEEGSEGCVRLGCTTSQSERYDPAATHDNGGCPPRYFGCTDSRALNFHPIFTDDDGSCVLGGCTESTARNFDIMATFDDGSCMSHRRILSIIGGRKRDASRRLSTHGCMAPGAPGYEPLATVHDPAACGSFPIYGCMDSLAINYMSAATAERADDPQTRCGENLKIGCMVPLAINFDSQANRNLHGECQYAFRGCTDSSSPSFAKAATADDGSCEYPVYGCADPTAWNYDSLAELSSGCEYSVAACMDPTARNYASDANVAANYLCVYPLYGCMFPEAHNFNKSATVDDGANPSHYAVDGQLPMPSHCMKVCMHKQPWRRDRAS